MKRAEHTRCLTVHSSVCCNEVMWIVHNCLILNTLLPVSEGAAPRLYKWWEGFNSPKIY